MATAWVFLTWGPQGLLRDVGPCRTRSPRGTPAWGPDPPYHEQVRAPFARGDTGAADEQREDSYPRDPDSDATHAQYLEPPSALA